jgi:catechol-2,3-dioxygenase
MPPIKLSHIVFQTNRKKEMQDWYCEVLEGHIVYENSHLAFMTYEAEHHRVAFVDVGPLTQRDRNADLAVPSAEQPGMHHVAFTFGSVGELLATCSRLAARGIRPFRSINHGPTTSMYYADPDGNRIELLVDNFATAAEGQAWMLSPAFARNPIGVDLDPEEHVRKYRSGVPEAELLMRVGWAAGASDGDPRGC